MHSIIDKDNKDIGGYIVISDDNYSSRIFTRFYNMCINEHKDPISIDTIRDMIKMCKYDLEENIIPIYDLISNDIELKNLKPGSVMIYINKTNKLYLATIDELDRYLKDNNYTSILSVNYVIGIPTSDGKFINVRPVTSNNATNAILDYKYRYNPDKEPVIVGVKEYNSLYISLNDHVLITDDIDENTITKE